LKDENLDFMLMHHILKPLYCDIINIMKQRCCKKWSL